MCSKASACLRVSCLPVLNLRRGCCAGGILVLVTGTTGHVAQELLTQLAQPPSVTACVMSAGCLCRQHDILFLKNKRFAGLKFPDMSHPTTLDAKLHGVLPSDALDFLK